MTDLFDWQGTARPVPRFAGSNYDPAQDDQRLTKQIDRIRDLMADSQWRTLSEIAAATGYGEASISAQLRHLTKPQHGGHTKEKRSRGDRAAGLWEYRLIVNREATV